MGEAFQLLRQRRQRCGLAVILNMPVINHRGADGFIVNKNDFRIERNPTFTEPKGTAPGFFPYFFSYLLVNDFMAFRLNPLQTLLRSADFCDALQQAVRILRNMA